MRAVTALALTSSTLLTANAFAQTTQPSSRRPDIVVFLADDLSVKDIAPYGETKIRTPNMTALAQTGLTFNAAYATSPSCAPSRAALLTGCYNLRTGAMFNHQKVAPDTKRWPAYFQSIGYEVVAIGKVSHYAQVRDYGFDYADFFEYHQDICVDKAVEWLASRQSDAAKREKPLCLFVGTNFPHVPWPERGDIDPKTVNLPAKNADTPRTRQARAKYVAAVERADSDLGKIRDAAARNLTGDTLFVFSADQGSQFPFAKWNLYDAGVHVPLIVSWPGHVAANARTDAMVSWIDLMPTLLDAAGASPKDACPGIDGQSFLPVLRGESQTHRDRVFSTHSGDGNMNYYPSRSVRIGTLRYIRNLDPTINFTTHVDRNPGDTAYFPSWVEHAKTDPKIADLVERYHHRPAEELYDIANDPGEWTNLANDPSHAGDLMKCRAALDEWMSASHDKGIASDEAVKPPK